MKEFNIDFSVINEFIQLLENCKTFYYDSNSFEYVIDDIRIKEEFLFETCSKFSHYINVINNTLLKKKLKLQSTSVDKEQLPDDLKKLFYKPKRRNKDAKKE